jgi:methylmalonyl-CoA decarboxylase subunit alpha
MDEHLERLRAAQDAARSMGGPERVARQHRLGKLTARERVDALLDPGSFVELGMLGRQPEHHREGKDDSTPADGVITGFGRIDGRPVCLAAYDFLVYGGSMGEVGNRKLDRVMKMSLQNGCPFICLGDGSGARVQEHMGSRAAEPLDLFLDLVDMSGYVPTVTAIMGPCFAGHANVAGLSDFVVMVRGIGSMGISGPPLSEIVIGERLTAEELGGSRVHCRETGMADLEAETETDALAKIRQFLGYMPTNSTEPPPRRTPTDDPDRRDDALLHLVPTNPRRAYDMRRVIRLLVDHGETMELKPEFARNLVTALARMNGRVVGVVANQPLVLAGVIDSDASVKAAHFVDLCDAFGIPLIFLMDVPGFMPGQAEEKKGIVRKSAKLIYDLARCTVPKITVVMRKAYGLGYYAMGGRGMGVDLIVAWPTAEISAMGPEGGVNILYRKEIEASTDREARRRQLIEEFRERITPRLAAEEAFIDDIIDPRDTRPLIIKTLEMVQRKAAPRYPKRHAITPS